MPSCEKCWRDARGDSHEYIALLESRNESGNECTPEQQAGDGAETCKQCGRDAMHIHCDVCMACGWKSEDSKSPHGDSDEKV